LCLLKFEKLNFFPLLKTQKQYWKCKKLTSSLPRFILKTLKAQNHEFICHFHRLRSCILFWSTPSLCCWLSLFKQLFIARQLFMTFSLWSRLGYPSSKFSLSTYNLGFHFWFGLASTIDGAADLNTRGE